MEQLSSDWMMSGCERVLLRRHTKAWMWHECKEARFDRNEWERDSGILSGTCTWCMQLMVRLLVPVSSCRINQKFSSGHKLLLQELYLRDMIFPWSLVLTMFSPRQVPVCRTNLRSQARSIVTKEMFCLFPDWCFRGKKKLSRPFLMRLLSCRFMHICTLEEPNYRERKSKKQQLFIGED